MPTNPMSPQHATRRTNVAMPPNIALLDRDKHGRPIPWFVDVNKEGIPDFRVIRRDGIPTAFRHSLCWVCGRHREISHHDTFILGPMCVANRIAPEPPSHRECAIYSVRACPFLATPAMRRRERNLPGTLVESPGTPILRNPGVAAVWVSKTWKTVHVDNGVLFDVGEPSQIQWFTEGRAATLEEVQHAFDTGLPALQQAAQTQGAAEVRLLESLVRIARSFFPAS